MTDRPKELREWSPLPRCSLRKRTRQLRRPQTCELPYWRFFGVAHRVFSWYGDSNKTIRVIQMEALSQMLLAVTAIPGLPSRITAGDQETTIRQIVYWETRVLNSYPALLVTVSVALVALLRSWLLRVWRMFVFQIIENKLHHSCVQCISITNLWVHGCLIWVGYASKTHTRMSRANCETYQFHYLASNRLLPAISSLYI